MIHWLTLTSNAAPGLALIRIVLGLKWPSYPRLLKKRALSLSKKPKIDGDKEPDSLLSLNRELVMQCRQLVIMIIIIIITMQEITNSAMYTKSISSLYKFC